MPKNANGRVVIITEFIEKVYRAYDIKRIETDKFNRLSLIFKLYCDRHALDSFAISNSFLLLPNARTRDRRKTHNINQGEMITPIVKHPAIALITDRRGRDCIYQTSGIPFRGHRGTGQYV
jgi:hypothetical protein